MNASLTCSSTFFGKHPVDAMVGQYGLHCASSESRNLASLLCEKIIG